MIQQPSAYLNLTGDPTWGSSDPTANAWYQALSPQDKASILQFCIHSSYYWAGKQTNAFVDGAYIKGPTDAVDKATTWWGTLTAAQQQQWMDLSIQNQYKAPTATAAGAAGLEAGLSTIGNITGNNIGASAAPTGVAPAVLPGNGSIFTSVAFWAIVLGAGAVIGAYFIFRHKKTATA